MYTIVFANRWFLSFPISDDKQSSDNEELKEKLRLDEFGDWLEKGQENLPSELRLRIEGE